MTYFSIVTPTIQRESLVRCCESVLRQTFTDWEMLVQIDDTNKNIDQKLWSKINPTRKIWAMECGVRHGNYGNSCRHLAWERARGVYLIHLDDDNFLYDNKVLEDIHKALNGPIFGPPDFAIFPIERHGQRFFHDPPGMCMTDTANVVVKREIGRWLDGPEYTMDGIWVENLKANHPYLAFPAFRPIVFMPKSSEGK